jgi:hypothetical protein
VDNPHCPPSGSARSWPLFGLSWAKVLDVVEPVDPDAAQRLRMIAAPEMPEWGEVGNGRSRVDDVKSTQGGNSSSYLAARLKRDHPDLAAEVEAGRMKIRAAARKAGIVKDPHPLAELKRWWDRATDMDRAQFQDFIDAWHAEQEGPHERG